MKVRIGRDELLTGLQRVQGVVEKRNTMPILSNVLLEARQEGAEIVATDLEIGMRGLYKAAVLETGGVTISARKLFEIIKELPSGDIELTTGENNWTTIQTGKSQFKIVGLPSADYPALPAIEREGLTPLSGDGLLELIRKTLFAAGDNDARYILNGLLVTLINTEKKTTLRLVGTDGHRLALAEHEMSQACGKGVPQEIKALIPKKAAQEMRRLLEEGA
ncbi:MAG: DNA polymerase III subunit beta [Nitrospira sp.]|nr:DNA polymerase III subunit beta [Nitrospira sp.]